MLETGRLILDAWQDDDWIAFRPIANDVEVMRYINGGVPWSDDEIRSFVERQVELYRTRGFCRWKLLSKPAHELIGFCGAGLWRDAADPEIGWWLARSCWGRGLATEAATQALDDAFTRVGLERIISIAMPENVASTRIMRKLGLAFDCEFESRGVRLVRYAMSRAQYTAAFSGGPQIVRGSSQTPAAG
jgi:ribosomal-protein-alanine N-acetyltransferase